MCRNRTFSACIETLENRLFLHSGPLQVTSVIADNRGEIFVTFNQSVKASNINTGTIQMYTAGADGILANGDDQRVSTALNYQASSNRLVIRSSVPADLGFRLKIVSTRLSSADGHVKLDGEFFTNAFPSGNGQAGGNFEFQSKNDRSSRPIMRISTRAGTLNVTMFRDTAPIAFANFRSYADAGDYDNSFFTRSASGVLEAGSLLITSNNDIVQGPLRDPIPSEAGRPNTRGTLAMVTRNNDPNSAQSQFLFNLANNTSANSGLTVFAEVRSGLPALDAIATLSTRDITGQFGTFQTADVTQVPINPVADSPVVNPLNELFVIRRIAQLVKIAPL